MKHQYYFLISIILFAIIISCENEGPKPEPIASFSISNMTAEIDEVITFTNLSENASNYFWDFGDGDTSTDESPTHFYLNGGIFTVKLSAAGDGCEKSTFNNITVTSKPVAKFATSRDIFFVDEVINFSNLSENATTYFWDFGDGSTSTDEYPTHSFSGEGNYTVELTSSSAKHSATFTKDITISDFSGKKVELAPGEEYEFNYSTYTSFGPSGFDVSYSGDGKEYFSHTGFDWISYFLVGDSYLSGAKFKYKAATNTPTGNYIGEFKITFKKGSSKSEITRSVMFIIK